MNIISFLHILAQLELSEDQSFLKGASNKEANCLFVTRRKTYF